MSSTENRTAIQKWAEDWIMDHINGEDGKLATQDEWLKMLRDGNMLQLDKITRFMVSLDDKELRSKSKVAFTEGLQATDVSPERAQEIVSQLFE